MRIRMKDLVMMLSAVLGFTTAASAQQREMNHSLLRSIEVGETQSDPEPDLELHRFTFGVAM